MTEYADFAALDEHAPEHERWAQYEQRKAQWLRDNPGAWPMELASFEAGLAQELGL